MSNPTPILALALRPKILDEVIGQSSVVAAIRKTFESGRQPIAWMFAGPTGTGKTTLAYIVARMIQGADFQGEPEIEVVNASDQNGVDAIRELIQKAQTYPLSGKRKVFLLNEVQKLTDSAQDCLLEPLEQDDSPTVWILTTTDPGKIKPALQGRCARFFLTGLAANDRTLLVEKAFEKLGLPKDGPGIDAFELAADKARLNLPREILNAVERFAAGVSAEEACSAPEDVRPDFIAIAQAVVAGNWNKTRQLLLAVKASDSLALRGMVASYLRGFLLNAEPGPRASILANCIASAFRFTEGFSSGTTHPGTVCWLYYVCDTIAAEKARKGSVA